MTTQEKFDRIMEVMSDYGHRTPAIIGHPLRLGDVIDWCENNGDNAINWMTTLGYVWKDKRKSLQPEDTELIDYIYSLII